MNWTSKLLLALIVILTVIGQASASNEMMFTEPTDTVIIELENGSRIIIYTRDRVELNKLQAYDINEMIRDLNGSIQGTNIDYMELEAEDGQRYLLESPNVFVGEGESVGDSIWVEEKELNDIRIRIGGMELNVDTDEIDDFEDDPVVQRYTYEEESHDWDDNSFVFEIGTNNWLENGRMPSEFNENYAVKPWGSWYVALNWINKTTVAGPVYIDWGAGVSWYNWKLENPDFQFVKTDTQVRMEDNLPPDSQSIKSKLTASYLNASFVPMIDFGGGRWVRGTRVEGFSFTTSRRTGFRIGAGVYGGYRLGSHSKYVIEESGNRDKIRDRDHFYLTNFRYGVRGQVGFGDIDFFVMYDLNNVFASGRGPEGAKLNAIAFGISI